MAAGPLCAAVEALATALASGPRPGGDRELDDAVDAVLTRLRAPLGVTAVGAVSTGKSTLVNALLGRALTPTGAGGCTRDPARYTGPEFTVVDTPGLGAPTAGPGAGPAGGSVTRSEPGPEDGLEQGADVVLYVLSGPADERDRATLARLGAGMVLGVLGRADLLDTDVGHAVVDHAAPGERLARDQAAALRGQVVDVVPVVGLLAHADGPAALSAADVEAVRELATVDGPTRELMLASPELFRAARIPATTAAARARLLDVLDLHGIRCVLRALDADPDMPPARVAAALHVASGVPRLRATLLREWGARADVLRADAALRALESVATPAREQLRAGLETLARVPEAHGIRLSRLLGRLRRGVAEVPDGLADEARQLGSGGDAGARLGRPGASRDELVAHARARAGWWRGVAGSAAGAEEADAAYTVHRAYFLLLDRLNR